MIALRINGRGYQADVPPDTPLLWVLRDCLNLTGTKFGCGKGICGSCTVLIDGEARKSCVTPAGSVQGKEITTIEGIPEDHPLKKAWIIEQVPQCGYCQSGQILQAMELLAKNPHPSEETIVKAMDGILCRCGTYPRIKRAVIRASSEVKGK